MNVIYATELDIWNKVEYLMLHIKPNVAYAVLKRAKAFEETIIQRELRLFYNQTVNILDTWASRPRAL